MPVRMQGIWIVHQPWYISFLWAMSRPFMSAKLQQRVHMWGDDVEHLFEQVDKAALPPEFHGTFEGAPMGFWDAFEAGRTDLFFQPGPQVRRTRRQRSTPPRH